MVYLNKVNPLLKEKITKKNFFKSYTLFLALVIYKNNHYSSIYNLYNWKLKFTYKMLPMILTTRRNQVSILNDTASSHSNIIQNVFFRMHPK